jgi:hypothetical protein
MILVKAKNLFNNWKVSDSSNTRQLKLFCGRWSTPSFSKTISYDKDHFQQNFKTNI